METLKMQFPYIYTRLDNDIHEIILTEASKKAVDIWMVLLDQIYAEYTAQDTVLILLDWRAGMQPVGYTFEKLREFMNQYADLPATRTAFLYGKDFLKSLIATLIESNKFHERDTVNFFADDQRNAAIQWLLEKS